MTVLTFSFEKIGSTELAKVGGKGSNLGERRERAISLGESCCSSGGALRETFWKEGCSALCHLCRFQP